MDVQAEAPAEEGSLLEIQRAYINKLIKANLKDHTVSVDFRDDYSKALSLFILYIQTFKSKAALTPDQLIKILQNKGFGTIASKLTEWRSSITTSQPEETRLPVPAQTDN